MSWGGQSVSLLSHTCASTIGTSIQKHEGRDGDYALAQKNGINFPSIFYLLSLMDPDSSTIECSWDLIWHQLFSEIGQDWLHRFIFSLKRQWFGLSLNWQVLRYRFAFPTCIISDYSTTQELIEHWRTQQIYILVKIHLCENRHEK